MANAPVNLNAKIGRKRRAAGWTLLTLSLLVAGVWVASGWWSLNHSSPRGWYRLSSGEFELGPQRDLGKDKSTWWSSNAPAPNWSWRIGDVSRRTATYNLGLFTWTNYAGAAWVEVILWPIPLLLCTPAAILLRSGYLARRRANSNACTKCSYSLAGLVPEAPCPECGVSPRETDHSE